MINRSEDISESIQVIVLGDALMDYQYWVNQIPPAGGDTEILNSRENVGGSALNTAVGLGWLGVPCCFCGSIGRDERGDRIKEVLTDAGVDSRLIQHCDHSGYVLSMVDKSGERTMFSYRDAQAVTRLSDIEDTVRQAKILMISGYMLASEKQAELVLEAMKLARAAGVKTALDASPVIKEIDPDLLKSTLSLCDILLPNRSELHALTGEDTIEGAEGRMGEIGVPCIAAKLGGGGSMMYTSKDFSMPNKPDAEQIYKVPADAVEAVDTTGAGDAFNAGFIFAYLQGLSPEKCLESGNRLAGRVISVKGAVSYYSGAANNFAADISR